MMEYTREFTICMSHCGQSGALELPNLFALMLDAATEHAEALGIGSKLVREKGVFWLTARSSARLLAPARLGQRVTLKTRIAGIRGSHSVREYSLYCGKTEIASCDTTFIAATLPDMRQIDIASVCPDLLPEAAAPERPRRRIGGDTAGARCLGQYTVRSVDIDLGGHMNNAVYPEVLFGLYSSRELADRPMRSMEIAYRAPCFEGDVLTAFEREEEGSRALILMKDGRPAALAWAEDAAGER